MLKERTRKISAIGTFVRNTIMIDDMAVEWIDAKEFNPADLAKLIGLDEEHRIKAKITFEVIEDQCRLCSEPTSGDKLCDICGEPICDTCAITDATGRYCPTCHRSKKQLNYP
jgi:formylmethanofuran dehydrogenase subunit E